MPPEKLYWQKSRVDFDRDAADFRDRMLPVLRTHQLYQLVGLEQALGIALGEFREAANKEDVRRGVRPPGTSINR